MFLAANLLYSLRKKPMNAPAETTSGEKLQFANSESKAVGFSGGLMNTLRDNAPRVVGVLKAIGDIAGAMVGHPFMIAFAAFGLVGRSFMVMWGTKKHKETLATEQAGKDIKPLGNSWNDSLQKMLKPRQYPMEAAAGMSLIAESCGAAYGAAELLEGNPGWTPLVLGALAVWSYSNILFKKEKKQDEAEKEKQEDPLMFGKSESKPVGIVGKLKGMMKDNPVLISSITNIGICAAAFVLSLIEGMKPEYLVYLGIGVGANLTQAILVRKNDYNVEGIDKTKPPTKEEKAQEKPANNNTPTHLVEGIAWHNPYKGLEGLPATA